MWMPAYTYKFNLVLRLLTKQKICNFKVIIMKFMRYTLEG